MPELTPAERNAILSRYESLYSAIERRTSPGDPLLLAHYTTVPVIEQILANNQIWLANPLYMNDLGEMRSGIAFAGESFPRFAQTAADTPDRVERLVAAYNHYLAYLAQETALDTYIFCASVHPFGDVDGRLSMWREYANQGNGAALVFNAQKFTYTPQSPLVIARVKYKTDAQRRDQIDTMFAEWARITAAANLENDTLWLAAYAAFDAAKALALTTKHVGFGEEDEWRVVYVPERDPLGYLKPCLDYFVGPRGVEPKLKLKFGTTYQPEQGKEGPAYDTGSLMTILEFILLGPSASSPISKKAFERMLRRINKTEFVDRVFPSTIPLRPRA